MRAIYFTNNGNVRENNEDGLIVGSKVQIQSMDAPKSMDGSFSILCVSDGMGGSEYGEYATKTFLSKLSKSIIENRAQLSTVVEETKHDLQGIDTGCAVAGIVKGEETFVFNIGDCRVYKKEGDFLNKLTHDHSVVQNLINSGEITEEEALEHPKKHVLTSALTPTSNIEIYTKKVRLSEGNIYLICTDGLWGEFGIEELESCFEEADIEMINTKIMQATESKKLEDNISYILLEV